MPLANGEANECVVTRYLVNKRNVGPRERGGQNCLKIPRAEKGH